MKKVDEAKMPKKSKSSRKKMEDVLDQVEDLTVVAAIKLDWSKKGMCAKLLLAEFIYDLIKEEFADDDYI